MLLIANLDCESEWARASIGKPLDAPPPIGGWATEVAAVAGSLMRALSAEEEDALWLPGHWKPRALALDPVLPTPRVLEGAWSALPALAPILAWGESDAVASLRARSSPAPAPSPARLGRPMADRLRALPPCAPDRAAAVNHRGFALRIAREAGWALPGACMVESIEAIDSGLELLRDRQGESAPWVLKAAWSAAGRHRLRGRGQLDHRPGQRAAARRLLDRHRQLCLEPWMDRVDDWALVGVIDEGAPARLGGHHLRCDAHGRFRGLDWSPGAPIGLGADSTSGPAGPSPERPLAPRVGQLTAAEASLLEQAFDAAGRALARTGYRGPFGVDAWRYRDAAGRLRFHPLGEINARLTMGLLAHAAGEALIARSAIPASASWLRLQLGARAPEDGPSVSESESGLRLASAPGGTELRLSWGTSLAPRAPLADNPGPDQEAEAT